MPTDWSAIGKQAAQATNAHFEDRISSLTRLNNDDISKLITETGISGKDLTSVLKEVKDATKSNIAKAEAISKIRKGVDVLVGIASKFV